MRVNIRAALATSGLLFALCACGQEAPSSSQSSTSSQSDLQATEVTTMTVMESLLQTLSAQPQWERFASIDGVQWFDAEPVPDEESEQGLVRSGKLLLQGFAETDLPNGKAGADFDYVRGNEGEAGVTLSGDAQSVNEIAVTKFYADKDYAEVLARQFADSVRLQAITASCPVAYGSSTGEENAQKTVFYQVSMPTGSVLYAEGAVIEDGGKYSPGSTIYRFYREKPVKRMEAMQCTEAES